MELFLKLPGEFDSGSRALITAAETSFFCPHQDSWSRKPLPRGWCSHSMGAWERRRRCVLRAYWREMWFLIGVFNQLISHNAFKLWCWRRLLGVPWTERRSNQSVLNIHWKDWCWNWSSNNLATWCEEMTHWKRPWCWGKLRAKEGGNRGWDGWMAPLTWWTWVWASFRRMVKDREGWHAAVHGVTKSWTWLSNWMTKKWYFRLCHLSPIHYSFPPLLSHQRCW